MVKEEGELVKKKRKIKVKGLLGGKSEIPFALVKDQYDYIPSSVWSINRNDNKELTDMVNARGKVYYLKDWDKENHVKLEFLPAMVKRCLQIWANKPNAKVLDPFMHSGVVPIMAAYFGKIGYGLDIVPLYCQHVETQKQRLLNEGNKWAKNIHVKTGNAKDIYSITEKIWGNIQFDYIITSPPFWNIRKYKSVEGQLSNINDYNKFLDELSFITNYLALTMKKGGYCSYVVNDFRKDGKLWAFHCDIISMFEEIGFSLHDIVINKLFTPYAKGVATYLKHDYTVKYHEYILTFKKT